MGDVYRARDPRLDRDVAIKVLPAAFARDAERIARFEREAKAAAAIAHANIVATFDFGVHETTAYLVMELLDGETLRERLNRGPLPVRKAVDYAIQVAHGLAAADEKGLVHRDLKPENIFLLHDGQVKVLDFGLARPARPAPPPSIPTGDIPTVKMLTDPGTVVGTVGYMAPEQVRGRTLDGRTDLFALGAVLYEMLSGTRAFDRDSAAETMTAILQHDPPKLGGTRGEISPALDQIVSHCLEKNPTERFQTARDVAFALGTLSATTGSSPATPAVTVTRGWTQRLVVAMLVVVAAGLGMFMARWLAPRSATFSFEKKTWHRMWLTNARFGPDGQSIVFSAALSGNVPELFVIRPESVLPQEMGRKATHLLSVSSKGELAVLTGARLLHHRLFAGTLARMTLDGEPRPWMENVREADWSPDGNSLAVIRHADGRDQLEYPAGQVRYQFAGYLSDPRVSPDGKQVAFFEHQFLDDDRGLVKLLTAAGEVRTLAGEYLEEEGLAWSADGTHVLFSATDRDLIRPFIVNVNGTPTARQYAPGAAAMVVYDVAADGRLLLGVRDEFRNSIRALVPGEVAEREMSWLDYATSGSLSSDYRTLVFTDMNQQAGPNYAVTLRNVASGRVIRLGDGYSWGLSPGGEWAGGWIPATGEIHLYPTGAGSSVRIDRSPVVHYTEEPQWFPDGRSILVCGNEAGAQPRCYRQPIAGGVPQPVTPLGTLKALLAPDGVTLLTQSTSGAFAVQKLGGDQGAPVPGMTAADVWIAISGDGRAAIVNVGSEIPARAERIDLATGKRTVLRYVAPSDQAGVVDLGIRDWLEDGRGYAYSYQRVLDSLFVATVH